MPTQVNFVPRPAQVAEGLFDADMKVSLVNDGPVTIVLDSAMAPQVCDAFDVGYERPMNSARGFLGLMVVLVVGAGCPGEQPSGHGGLVIDAGRVATDASGSFVDAGGTQGGVDAGAGTTAAQVSAWCDRVNHLLAEVGSRCGVSAPAYIEPSFPDERCVVAAALLDAGTLVFDAVVAQRCLDESLAGCTVPAGVASCRAVLSGLVIEGGACDSVECERQLYCDLSGATCPGHCRGRVDAGVAPRSSEACALGTFSFEGSPCHVPQPVGAPCFINSKFYACVSGSFCTIGAASSTCQPLRDAGSPCAEGTAICKTGVQCVSVNGTSPTCVPFGSVGDSCAIDPPEHLGYPSRGCKHGLACGDAGICEPGHARGQSCQFDSHCARGWCNRAPVDTLGACADFLPAPATCTSNDRCVEGTRCEGTCTAVARAGQACTDKVGCEPFFTCDSTHHCTSPRWTCTK